MTTKTRAPISLENAKKLVTLIENGENQAAQELRKNRTQHPRRKPTVGG